MPCLRMYSGAISIYFKALGRNWGSLEAAADVVYLSLLQVLYSKSEQQMRGGRQYPLYHLGA